MVALNVGYSVEIGVGHDPLCLGDLEVELKQEEGLGFLALQPPVDLVGLDEHFAAELG